MNLCRDHCQPARRSLSAATDRETSRKGMRSPVYLAIKRNAPKPESSEAFLELLSRFELESMSRGAGSAGARSDLGSECASRKRMRSPVYLAIKRNAPKPESSEAFLELLSRFELESMSRGAGSAGARSDLGSECASRKRMRSPVYLAIKRNAPKPESSEAFLELLSRFELETSSLPMAFLPW